MIVPMAIAAMMSPKNSKVATKVSMVSVLIPLLLSAREALARAPYGAQGGERFGLDGREGTAFRSDDEVGGQADFAGHREALLGTQHVQGCRPRVRVHRLGMND